MQLSNRKATIILLLGDGLALLLFVFVGQCDHQLLRQEKLLSNLLRSSLPFLLVWPVVALLLGALDASLSGSWRALVGRTLTAWLIAAPLALLLRGLWLQRATIPTLFLAATLGFGLLFLVAWRLPFALLYRWRQRD